MTDLNLSHIVGIVDRSGSMANIAEDTAGGWATFLKEQSKVEGQCVVTLVEFDTSYDVAYKNVDVNDVPEYTLIPRGGTALYDAIGRAVTDKGAELRALPENKRPGSVTVVVLTDGHENSSREWRLSAIKDLITKQQEKYSWNFVFLAANQDAVLTGSNLGFYGSNSLTYAASSQGVRSSFAAAATNTASFRGSMASGSSYSHALKEAAFTDDDRQKATAK